MPLFGMLRRVAFVRADVSEEGCSVLRLLVTVNVVSSSPPIIIMIEAILSSET
jgi:hypothetical protein